MTPADLYNYIQFQGNVPNNVAPFTSAQILLLVNTAKNNISGEIVKINPNYFETTSDADTVVNQQDYQKPTDLLLLKRLDVSYIDTNTGSYNRANQVTLDQLSDFGEDYYQINQPTNTPLFRFAGTQLYLYPKPQTGTAGVSFLRLWYIQYPADLANLTDSSSDIETLNGFGKGFHELLGDYVVNQIKGKKGELSPMDVQKYNAHILQTLVPNAFRNLSTPSSAIPNDLGLQL